MSDRKHLVSAEVEKLITAVKGARHETRDRCLLLLMFLHGLRVSEACGLALSQVDIESRVLHVNRLKDGLSTTHPLRGDEIRAIKAWLADRVRMKPKTDTFFISERRRPLSRKTAWLMIRDYSRLAGLSVEAHPHMLRHACGFALADQGADTRLIQDYLGHRNIQHTVRYTAPTRHGLNGSGGKPVVAKAGFSWYSEPMEQTPFEFTPEQKGILATLSRETGKPIPALLAEALEVLQEHERAGHDHGTTGDREATAPVASPQEAPKPIWEIFEEASRNIPDAELARVPTDLAAQVDHYVYGLPKR